MILVTGGTGLVGAHLLYRLAEKNETLVAIHRSSSKLEPVKHVFSYYTDAFEALFDRIQWVEADLNDISTLQDAFKGITEVYHAAAFISFHTFDYKAMRKVNIEGTTNIVNLCISQKIKKLCFVSSIAAVGKPSKGFEVTEDLEWHIDDNNYGYAITKYGAETEVWRASQEGVPVVIVNPGVILGAGFWHQGSGKVFSNIYEGFKFYTDGVTGFVSVQDVVKSMVAFMESDIKNERYILVSDSISFKTLFFKIADAMGVKRPHIKVKPWLSGLVWRLNWLLYKISGKTPAFSKQSAKSAHSHHIYINKKIKQALGYEFEPLNTTIEHTAALFLKDKGR